MPKDTALKCLENINLTDEKSVKALQRALLEIKDEQGNHLYAHNIEYGDDGQLGPATRRDIGDFCRDHPEAIKILSQNIKTHLLNYGYSKELAGLVQETPLLQEEIRRQTDDIVYRTKLYKDNSFKNVSPQDIEGLQANLCLLGYYPPPPEKYIDGMAGKGTRTAFGEYMEFVNDANIFFPETPTVKQDTRSVKAPPPPQDNTQHDAQENCPPEEETVISSRTPDYDEPIFPEDLSDRYIFAEDKACDEPEVSTATSETEVTTEICDDDCESSEISNTDDTYIEFSEDYHSNGTYGPTIEDIENSFYELYGDDRQTTEQLVNTIYGNSTAAAEISLSSSPICPVEGYEEKVLPPGYSFGRGRPSHIHQGSDIPIKRGTPIMSPADGVVIATGNHHNSGIGMGKYIIIRHENGFCSKLYHNDKVLVKNGDVVKQGQEIAKSGATGAIFADKPGQESRPHYHSHVEFWLLNRDRQWVAVDPYKTFGRDISKVAVRDDLHDYSAKWGRNVESASIRGNTGFTDNAEDIYADKTEEMRVNGQHISKPISIPLLPTNAPTSPLTSAGFFNFGLIKKD